MQILSLKIKNLASISEAEIDFHSGALADKSLILITGHTGSGKTTILDAISLALYNNTPRLAANKNIGQFYDNSYTTRGTNTAVAFSRPETIVRKGQDEAYARLTFVGIDGLRYTASWDVSRTPRSRKISSPRRTLIHHDNNDRPEEIKGNMTIDHIIGLSFEQFCRTTMLAQGEFAKFLQSNRDEKAAILEKITGTEIYSQIGIKISEKHKAQRDLVAQLDLKLNALKPLTDDELTAINTQLATLAQETQRLTNERDQTLVARNYLARLAELEESHTASSANLKRLEAELSAPANALLEQDIKLWKETEELRTLIGKRRETDRKLATAKGRNETFKTNYLNALRSLTTLSQQLGSNTLQTINESLTKLDKYLSDLNKTFEANDKQLRTLDPVATAKTKQIVAQLTDQQEKLANISANIANQTKQIALLNNKLDELKREEATSKATYELRQAQYDSLATQKTHAQALQQALKIGDTCPVCSNTITYISIEKLDAHIAATQAERDQASKHYRKAQDERANCQSLLTANQTTLSKYAKDQATITTQIHSTTNSLTAHLHPQTVTTADDLAALRTEIETREQQIATLREKIDQLRRDISQQNSEQSRLVTLLRKATDLNTMAESQRVILSIATLWQSQTTNPTTTDVDTTDAVRAWKNLEVDIKAWHQEVKTLQEEMAQNTVAQDRYIAANPSHTPAKVGALLDVYSPKSIATHEETLADLHKRHQHAKTTHEQATTDLLRHQKNKPTVETNATPQTLKTHAEALERALAEANTNIGRLKQRLTDNNRKRDELSATQEQKDIEDAKLRKLSALYSLLGDAEGKKFRAIAQSYILAQVLSHANVHLQMLTGNRFSLMTQNFTEESDEIGDLSFLLRDAENGDAIMTTANISGGQGFMVSLALTLGLSSLSNSGSASADIIFIDEGFGTLDSSYLELVINLLERLQETGGRRVAIISHIQQLKERIPTQIVVEKGGVRVCE